MPRREVSQTSRTNSISRSLRNDKYWSVVESSGFRPGPAAARAWPRLMQEGNRWENAKGNRRT